MVDLPPVSASTAAVARDSAASARRPRGWFPVLGAAYLVQGCVYGLGAFVLLPRLAGAGVELPMQAAILSLAGLPWVFKLAWAPMVDRWLGQGRERHGAAVAMLGVATGLALLREGWAPLEPGWIAVVWLGINMALSLQDVAIDALTLRRTEAIDRGRANAWMLSGHHLGFEGLGGLVLGVVAAERGIDTAIGVAMVGIACLAPTPWLLRHRPAAEPSPTPPRASWKAAFPRLSVCGWAFAALLADTATSAVSAALLVQELHWDPAALAFRLPVLALGSTLCGMVLAGRWVDRHGHRGAAARASIALGGIWLGFAVARSWWTTATFVLVVVAAQGLSTAVFYVAMHAWLMDRTAPRWRATTFAILMAVLNMPRVIAPMGAVWLLGVTGWVAFFALCGMVQIAYGGLLARYGGGR